MRTNNDRSAGKHMAGRRIHHDVAESNVLRGASGGDRNDLHHDQKRQLRRHTRHTPQHMRSRVPGTTRRSEDIRRTKPEPRGHAIQPDQPPTRPRKSNTRTMHRRRLHSERARGYARVVRGELKRNETGDSKDNRHPTNRAQSVCEEERRTVRGSWPRMGPHRRGHTHVRRTSPHAEEHAQRRISAVRHPRPPDTWRPHRTAPDTGVSGARPERSPTASNQKRNRTPIVQMRQKATTTAGLQRDVLHRRQKDPRSRGQWIRPSRRRTRSGWPKRARRDQPHDHGRIGNGLRSREKHTTGTGRRRRVRRLQQRGLRVASDNICPHRMPQGNRLHGVRYDARPPGNSKDRGRHRRVGNGNEDPPRTPTGRRQFGRQFSSQHADQTAPLRRHAMRRLQNDSAGGPTKHPNNSNAICR